MRYSLCFLLSTCFLGLSLNSPSYAAEAPFKKTSAFWLRGSSISVLPDQQVTLLFSIVKKDGSAHTTFSGTVQTNIGVQAKISPLGEGLYEAQLPFFTLEKPTLVQLTLKGKGVSKLWKDTWYPKASGNISISTPLSTIILSEQKTPIPIDITVQGPRADQAKLRFKASSGKVKKVKNLGKGNYRAEYIPYKKNRAPKNVLISVSDQNNPQELYGSTVLPMYSKINLPVDAPAGTEVMLDIAGKKTPAIKVDANGKAVFDVLVPPNIRTATLLTQGDLERKDEIDLNIPEQRSLVFIPPPRNIPANTPIKVYFFAVDDLGKPTSSREVNLSVNLGSISPPKHLKDGIYESIYTPDFTNKRTKVTIRADDNKKTKYSFYVDAQQPQKLILKPKVSSLDASETLFNLEAQLFGDRLAPLSERKLHIESSAADLKKIDFLPFGNYNTTVETTLDSNLSLITHVHDDVSKNPATGFVVDAQNLRFSPLSAPFKLVVVSHDHFGSPVGDVPFSVSVKKGDVQLSESKGTNKQGFSYITVTPGEKEGPITLEIQSDSISSSHTLFQFSETIAPSLSSENTSGTKQDQKIVQSWRNSISFLSIPREESVDTKKKPKTRVQSIELTHTPSKGRPGGEAKLNIVVKDKQQKGVTGAKLRAFSSLGKISSIKELRDGTYEALLSIPNSIQQDIDIEVELIGSRIQEKQTLAVSKGEARKESIPAPVVIAKSPQKKPRETAAVAPPVEVPKQRRVKKPRKPFKWPSFSLSLPTFSSSANTEEKPFAIDVGMVLGKYGYQQEPFVSNGALYGSRIAFNNEIIGSAPADSLGLSTRLRANTSTFAPSVSPFLLLEARVFSYNYAVALEEFAEPISDWNTQIDVHAIPRYSFSVSNHRGHVGARLGWSMDDVILFQQTLDGENINLSFAPQNLQGPSLGFEVAYTAPVGLSIDAYSGIGMMGGIYRREAGTTISYPLGSFGVQAGFRWIDREITLEGSQTDLGVVTDNNLFGQLGINIGF